MKSLLAMVPFVVLLSVGCGRERQDNPRELAPLNGSWKGRHVTRFERPFSEIVLFSRRPDSSLALSLKYEIGPRSRIWKLNEAVSYRQGTFSWNKDQGALSAGKDSMRVVRQESGGTTEWTFVRDRSVDSLLSALWELRPEPYVYSVPAVLSDGWDCADFASVGLEKSKIIKLIGEIRLEAGPGVRNRICAKSVKPAAKVGVELGISVNGIGGPVDVDTIVGVTLWVSASAVAKAAWPVRATTVGR